jgi:CRISPR/Cas system-associated exonuclease Cas4 (RecB family)
MGSNDILWSLSRHKMLMECEMKCALNYYVAKRGEFETKPPLLQLAWRMKNMTNVYLLVGDQIHQIIESEIRTLFETGEVLNETKIKEELNNKIEEYYSMAESGMKLWYKDPKVNPMLFEIFYDGGLTDKIKHFIKKKVETCINGFMQSSTLKDNIYKGNVKIMESEKYRSFKLDGIRIILSADLIYFDEINEQWHITDWKTGKESEYDPVQLALYGMYLQAIYGADLSEVVVTNEYLESGISKSYIVDTYETQNLREIVKQSVKRMAQLERNLNKQDDEILDVFQKTENKEVCERCNFKAVCVGEYKDKHIKNFLKGIGKTEGDKKVKERDMIMMREWVRSGMPIQEGLAEFLEESPHETEDSYTSKLERMSEMMGY